MLATALLVETIWCVKKNRQDASPWQTHARTLCVLIAFSVCFFLSFFSELHTIAVLLKYKTYARSLMQSIWENLRQHHNKAKKIADYHEQYNQTAFLRHFSPKIKKKRN